MPKFDFIGVDGCPCGWFSVGFSRSGEYEFKTFPTFRCLLDHYRAATLILVDIPIGLPTGSEGRICDKEARKKLGKRGSSVFPAPTRSTMEHVAQHPDDYKGAKSAAMGSSGKSISKQTFAISHKIADVDDALLNYGGGRVFNVREIHPEVLFWAFNNRNAMTFRKKERGGKGIDERIRVLEQVEPRTRAIYDKACTKFLRKDVARDDILDALVAAVTARLGSEQIQKFPMGLEESPTDGRELPMEMVFWISNRENAAMTDDN